MTGLVAQDTTCTKTTSGTDIISVTAAAPSIQSSVSNTAPLPCVGVTEPVPSVVKSTLLPSSVSTPNVGSVPIPVPAAPQPVPTRNFAKAISDLQNQLQGKSVKKEASVKQKEQGGRLPEWSQGDLVVARRPDGVWMKATIVMVNTAVGKAKVNCEGQEVVVDLINLRSPSLPVEALNLIDQGLSDKNNSRQKGEGEGLDGQEYCPAQTRCRQQLSTR